MSMKLYVVGFGSGSFGSMTKECVEAIEKSEVIIGYTVYAELMKNFFPNKIFLTTPMKREKERVILAFDEASKGKTAALICSGDSGIYGMAGLVYELSARYPDVEIEIVPGVTAAISGAALVGAPLTHDFAVISLSDLLTAWEKIEKRLRCASMADFTIVLYNPSSKKRADYLKKACDIMLEYKTGDTVCAAAKNIGRIGEQVEIMTLEKLRDTAVDMFTTVFVGNSETKVINGKMVTPRGYRNV